MTYTKELAEYFRANNYSKKQIMELIAKQVREMGLSVEQQKFFGWEVCKALRSA